MNTFMRKLSAVLAIFLLTSVIPIGLVATVVVGCKTTVAPGSDPFVVESEKDLRTAFYVVDGFLTWELANRATAGKDVTAVADALRTSFPQAYKSALDTLSVYKQNRDTTGRANVTTLLATINAAMLEAMKNLPQAQASAALKKAATPIK